MVSDAELIINRVYISKSITIDPLELPYFNHPFFVIRRATYKEYAEEWIKFFPGNTPYSEEMLNLKGLRWFYEVSVD